MTSVQKRPRDRSNNVPTSSENATGDSLVEDRSDVTKDGDNAVEPSTASKDGNVFFGESSSLNFVTPDMQTSPASDSQREVQSAAFSHPIADHIKGKIRSTTAESSEQSNSLTVKYLRHQEALLFPEKEHCEPVFQAYFRWFHPCFPILDRYQTAELYLQEKLSPILFHSILFVGVAYCSDQDIQRLGFNDIGEAKQHFYRKAHALFNSGWESNRFTVLQAVFLMSFVRTQLFSVHNVRHWLGIAVTLAQELGLHRSYVLHEINMMQV